MIVNSAAELEQLPDGTIITWLRIPGDRTSEAVAFVRAEYESMGPGVRGMRRVTWISPGGWDPKSVEDAGVNFPCVAFTDPSPYAEAEAEVETFPLITGGTWPREAALAAAAQVAAGNAVNSREWVGAEAVLTDAAVFADWLAGEPPVPAPPTPEPETLDADDAEVAMDFDLRELIGIVTSEKQNIAALALALTRRGWTRRKETE
ncbi:hypothetical protein KAYACHO_53 [Mycobacterium phage KayaCho]|uniref:hypothetical protein n=1 Tax=Mycobacterium phage KayaCho TaxID=1340830 RepID=UPI0003880C62|nr:hypothetical protein N846_gp53 [Mycobacterium phage KayaCho]AGT12957.1 hypothetical protein KAYACHO_53 [Mycobacterium phage KayaCho]